MEKYFFMVTTIVRLHVGNLWCVQEIFSYIVLVCPGSLVWLVCPEVFSACVIGALLKKYQLNTRTVRGVFLKKSVNTFCFKIFNSLSNDVLVSLFL